MPLDSRRQIYAGVTVIGLVGLLMTGFWFARLIPGEIGAWFSMVVGIFTSPFLMPVGFILLGFFVVNTVNSWRRHKEGEELVYLETAVGPGSESLPEHAKSVIYANAPEDVRLPSPKEKLEGALAIQDYASAVEILAEMDEEERATHDILRLRLQLAEETGKTELVQRLQANLRGAEE